MNDMSSVIVPKSDQINADDLIAGPMTITITSVAVRGGQEQPVSVSFEGSKKVFRPCKSMCRVMVNAWGPDANRYVGKSMTLYRDPSVKWGGMDVGGIRISHMTDIERDMVMALTEKKGSRKPFIVKPLVAPPTQEPPPVAAPKKPTLREWIEDAITATNEAPDIGALLRLIDEQLKTFEIVQQRAPDQAQRIEEARRKRHDFLADAEVPQ